MAQLRAPAPPDPSQGEAKWPGSHWTKGHSPMCSPPSLFEDSYFRCQESPDASENSSMFDAEPWGRVYKIHDASRSLY